MSADLSSAIVINGKSNTLDLQACRTDAGRQNYIASSKGERKSCEQNDIMTGESITVKGTQLAYLLPAELLGTGEQSYQNPMDVATFQVKICGSQSDWKYCSKMDTPVAALGRKDTSRPRGRCGETGADCFL